MFYINHESFKTLDKNEKIIFFNLNNYFFIGYVFSKEALYRFNNISSDGKSKLEPCGFEDYQENEDIKIGRCLESLDVQEGESIDEEGKSRLYSLSLETAINTDDRFVSSNMTSKFHSAENVSGHSSNVNNILIKI